jgi:hypothetical protein
VREKTEPRPGLTQSNRKPMSIARSVAVSPRVTTRRTHGQGHRFHHHVGRRLRHRTGRRTGTGSAGASACTTGGWAAVDLRDRTPSRCRTPTRRSSTRWCEPQAAGSWPRDVRRGRRVGRHNPFPGTLVVLTHRLDDQPDPANGFHFVEGLDHALPAPATTPATRTSPSAAAPTSSGRPGRGVVDTLVISTAPVILGAASGSSTGSRRTWTSGSARAPLRVGRPHDVRRGALTRTDTRSTGYPDVGVVATLTNGQQRRQGSPYGPCARRQHGEAPRRCRGRWPGRTRRRRSRGHREHHPEPEIVRARRGSRRSTGPRS